MNKTFLGAILVAVFLVAGSIYFIWKYQPSMQEQQERIFSGAVREGSPEFDAVTKKIIIENDQAVESPIGLGTIMMGIDGKIRNNSDRTLTGLEIRVSVLDSFDKVVKDKTLIVVPYQQKKLEPKGEMDVTVRIDGFEKSDDRARISWKVTAIKLE